MKKAYILLTIFQLLFTELINAILYANKMQHFQDTKNPYVKVGFIHFIKVMNMTLNAIPTRNITTSNVDKCNIECFMAIPICFGLNFVHTTNNMDNATDSTNCKMYQEEVAIYDLVQNENVDHYALENPCLTLPCLNGGTCIRNVTLDTHTCKCAFFYSGTNCGIYEERKPEKNSMIKVMPILRRTWSLSIDIKPIGLIESWANIVHATMNENGSKYGYRTPAIFFLPNSLELYISSAVKGDLDHKYFSVPLPLNQYTNVNVSQVLLGNAYVYSILINGSKAYEVVNTDAREFKDVNLYDSNPWEYVANAYIRNLIYEQVIEFTWWWRLFNCSMFISWTCC